MIHLTPERVDIDPLWRQDWPRSAEGSEQARPAGRPACDERIGSLATVGVTIRIRQLTHKENLVPRPPLAILISASPADRCLEPQSGLKSHATTRLRVPIAAGTSWQTRYGQRGYCIAGAAEGLGAAMAEALAQQGLHLWLLDRQPKPLAENSRTVYAETYRDLKSDTDGDRPRRCSRESLRSGRQPSAKLGLVACTSQPSIPIGPFARINRSSASSMPTLEVNCAAHRWRLVHRVRRPAMLRLAVGAAIILFSSMAGFQGSAQLFGHIRGNQGFRPRRSWRRASPYRTRAERHRCRR